MRGKEERRNNRTRESNGIYLSEKKKREYTCEDGPLEKGGESCVEGQLRTKYKGLYVQKSHSEYMSLCMLDNK